MHLSNGQASSQVRDTIFRKSEFANCILLPGLAWDFRSPELNIIGNLEFVGFEGIGLIDLGGEFFHSHACG